VEQADLDKELNEADRLLRQVRKEIEETEETSGPLRERYEVSQQAELDAKTAAGEDVLEFVPSAKLQALKSSLDRTEQRLQSLREKEREILERTEELKTALIESRLLEESKLFRSLERRKEGLLAELKEVEGLLAESEQRRRELAEKIVSEGRSRESEDG